MRAYSLCVTKPMLNLQEGDLLLGYRAECINRRNRPVVVLGLALLMLCRGIITRPAARVTAQPCGYLRNTHRRAITVEHVSSHRSWMHSTTRSGLPLSSFPRAAIPHILQWSAPDIIPCKYQRRNRPFVIDGLRDTRKSNDSTPLFKVSITGDTAKPRPY